MKKIFILGFAAIMMASCAKEEKIVVETLKAPNLPSEPYAYSVLNLPVNAQLGNAAFGSGRCGSATGCFGDANSGLVTDHGATLGRVLFYDKNLSLNNTVACASCHHQDKAFSDGQQFSKGFEGRMTTRNSMSFCNAVTFNNLFWDSRSKNLFDLALRPVQNHIEMGMEKIDNLVAKVATIPYYKQLFQNAFGTEEINADRISDALSQFIASITSNQSKFDAVQRGEAAFTSIESMGKQIFDNKCTSCHAGSNLSAADFPGDPYGGGGGFSSIDVIGDFPINIITDFTGNLVPNGFFTIDKAGTTNIGLDLVATDTGRDGNFRIPTLRNVALTAPYMHDGRFKTLEEVVHHYSENIRNNPNLDPKFKDELGNVKPFHFTTIEKKALIAFLNTFTDTAMTKDIKYSNPF